MSKYEKKGTITFSPTAITDKEEVHELHGKVENNGSAPASNTLVTILVRDGKDGTFDRSVYPEGLYEALVNYTNGGPYADLKFYIARYSNDHNTIGDMCALPYYEIISRDSTDDRGTHREIIFMEPPGFDRVLGTAWLYIQAYSDGSFHTYTYDD